ncbi:MAG: thioredoxin family protein [Candidatus Shikimatogenerans bostrichidophilus]|nr:MAG: thioredoxin family protein [Candidatus Shikimatogenerans bostrichidophilus]
MKKNNLIKILKKNKYCIFFFYTLWCQTCLYVKPIFNKIKKKFKKKIYFLSINIEKKKYSKNTKIFNINYIPTFIFFKKSIEKKRYLGVINKKKFKNKCLSLIK